LGNTLTFPLYAGATAVLEEERPSPDTVARVFAQHQPTIFCGVPTLFAQLLAKGAIDAASAPRLRLSTSAGEALPAHLGERWRATVGTDILDGIGSTELLHIFLSNRPGDVRYGTTGTAVPGYALRLVGDDGRDAGPGEEGSLWVSGDTAAIGYHAQRERSLATFHGPWTRTGDRYLLRADGAYVYAGRADDMLKVGGIWVSPFEVESALASHAAVLECAVVGCEDEQSLTKPKAFVVLAPGQAASGALEDALKAHVRDRLAAYKYPRWIVFVDELPKTATGKVQRYKLRASG
jgi:benzoate-CoA ligase family protein